ncbi:MAG: FtsX-like permease family protein [Rikenellaceae bacterium]
MILFARKYLFSPKSHSVINIIAGVSLLSVATPVAAVIILLSIFNGFGTLVEGLDSAVEADLVVRRSRSQELFDPSAIDTSRIAQIRGVEGVALQWEQSVMVESGGAQTLLRLRGVDDNYQDVVDLTPYIYVGDFDVALGDLDRLVLGNTVAGKLGIRQTHGSFVNIFSLSESALSELLPVVDFNRDSAKVVGVFRLDLESEGKYGYTSRRLISRLNDMDDEGESHATDVVIKLAEGADPKRVKSEVAEVVGDGFGVYDRYDLNPLIYDIIRYERWGIGFISLLVMLLASFSLIGTVAMLIIEKRREMLTLRSMGATWRYIRGIFLAEGLLIGAVGTTIGVVLGVALTLIQQVWGVIEIPASSFLVTAYPVDLQLLDVLFVIVMSMSIAYVLSYIVSHEMIKPKGEF